MAVTQAPHRPRQPPLPVRQDTLAGFIKRTFGQSVPQRAVCQRHTFGGQWHTFGRAAPPPESQPGTVTVRAESLPTKARPGPAWPGPPEPAGSQRRRGQRLHAHPLQRGNHAGPISGRAGSELLSLFLCLSLPPSVCLCLCPSLRPLSLSLSLSPSLPPSVPLSLRIPRVAVTTHSESSFRVTSPPCWPPATSSWPPVPRRRGEPRSATVNMLTRKAVHAHVRAVRRHHEARGGEAERTVADRVSLQKLLPL